MAIEIDVIPARASLCRWAELRECMVGGSVSAISKWFFGDVPALCELNTKRRVAPDEQLVCPAYYYFDVPGGCTLSLTVEAIEGGDEEREYLSDFGRCIPESVRGEILRAWSKAGFMYSVASFGGRRDGELVAILDLARCLATLSCGYLVIMDSNVLPLAVGVYPSQGDGWPRT